MNQSQDLLAAIEQHQAALKGLSEALEAINTSWRSTLDTIQPAFAELLQSTEPRIVSTKMARCIDEFGDCEPDRCNCL